MGCFNTKFARSVNIICKVKIIHFLAFLWIGLLHNVHYIYILFPMYFPYFLCTSLWRKLSDCILYVPKDKNRHLEGTWNLSLLLTKMLRWSLLWVVHLSFPWVASNTYALQGYPHLNLFWVIWRLLANTIGNGQLCLISRLSKKKMFYTIQLRSYFILEL